MRSSDPRVGLRWTLPVFTSLAGYRRAWLVRDLVAGVLVVAIAIPLSMGMAEVAGMPPIVGLYSCVLPLLAYALFGSSPQLVIALDASTAAMVAAAVAPLAAGDQIRYAELAGAVALIVGGVLIVAGLLRLGFVANLLSRPVLLGYQAGLALVVIFSQLPKLLGLEVVEDMGLGAANLASGVSGGITTSASAARTAVVEMVGGRSQVASVTAALLMVMVLLFLTRPLEKVRTAALAAVVVGAVVRLIEVRSLCALWRIRRTEFAIAMATIVGAVAVGLLQGIIIGVSLSLLDHFVRVALLRRGGEPPGRAGPVVIATGPAADDGIDHADLPSTDEILVRADGLLFFANAHRLKEAVRARVSEQPAATRVVVDASRVTDADATVAEMLAELGGDLDDHGVTLVLTELRPPVRDVLKEGAVRGLRETMSV